MAKAPKPGAARKAEEMTKARRRALVITLNGASHTLHMADLGPEDDLAARRQTGMPISSFIGDDIFGADSMLVLWWMARRKAGERRLAFSKVLAQFPTFESINDADPSVEAVEDDDVIEAEVAADPLGSGGD